MDPLIFGLPGLVLFGLVLSLRAILLVVREKEAVVLVSRWNGAFSRLLTSPGVHAVWPFERMKAFSWHIPESGHEVLRIAGNRLSLALATARLPPFHSRTLDGVTICLRATALYRVDRTLVLRCAFPPPVITPDEQTQAREEAMPADANILLRLASDVQDVTNRYVMESGWESVVTLADLNLHVTSQLQQRAQVRPYGAQGIGGGGPHLLYWRLTAQFLRCLPANPFPLPTGVRHCV